MRVVCYFVLPSLPKEWRRWLLSPRARFASAGRRRERPPAAVGTARVAAAAATVAIAAVAVI